MSDPRLDALFVYGTLRTGAGHPMHEILAAGGRLIGRGTVPGRLVVVDWYPGLVPLPPQSQPGRGVGNIGDTSRVRGEVWELSDMSVLAALDDYEGCGADDAQPHEFVRAPTVVTLDAGPQIEAWTYRYALCADDLAIVPDGDWLTRVKRSGGFSVENEA